jgi:hypothetical protein
MHFAAEETVVYPSMRNYMGAGLGRAGAAIWGYDVCVCQRGGSRAALQGGRRCSTDAGRLKTKRGLIGARVPVLQLTCLWGAKTSGFRPQEYSLKLKAIDGNTTCCTLGPHAMRPSCALLQATRRQTTCSTSTSGSRRVRAGWARHGSSASGIME